MSKAATLCSQVESPPLTHFSPSLKWKEKVWGGEKKRWVKNKKAAVQPQASLFLSV